jgi:two-component sensor histidine kinase
MPEHGTRTDAAAYVRNLCLSIRRSKLNQMKIQLVFAAGRLWLQPERCWLLGMIIHELITNAARHAFAGGDGWIRVELLREGAFVECRVLDNGSAPEGLQPGRGLKIVHELTKALDGRFCQKFATGGSTSIVAFPSSVEPQRKHKSPRPSVASVRSRISIGLCNFPNNMNRAGREHA